MAQATDYGDPAKVALRWQNEGAQYLHVVDLDAAFSGEFSNRDAVAKILEAVHMPVQLGGGVRSMEDIKERLKMGVARVIIGTAAFEAPELVAQAAAKYPGAHRRGHRRKGRACGDGGAGRRTQRPARCCSHRK